MDFTFEPENKKLGEFTVELESDSNIVQFPKLKLRTPPQSIEEMRENIAESQTEMAIDIAYAAIANALLYINRAGFNTFSKIDSAYDMMFCIEAVKSMILRTCDIEHPFQEISTDIIEIDNPEEVMDQFLMND
jgi:hypothetical protein